MIPRIAAVQHGDYAEAQRIIGAGEPEPYFGMAYTLRVLEALFAGSRHLVVSLNAPPYRRSDPERQLVGLPAPAFPRPIPGTLALLAWGRRIRRELERFEPTHVLLRAAGIPACEVLDYCVRRRVSTLVVFANRFERARLKDRLVNRRLARLLEDPSVFLVGNHKAPATASMVECGIDPRKAVAWDWPDARHPKDFPEKTLPGGELWRIAYVGAMDEAKGVGDLLEAVVLLHAQGLPVRLVAAGAGPHLERLRQRAASLPEKVARFPGRVGNEEAFHLMRESALVCVPSRHAFAEGMPLSLTEALASRTPVIVSDHPILVRAFADGEGVRLFRASDPRALAAAIRGVLEDPEEYSRLSRTTAAAFARVECRTYFGDLVERWRRTF